MIKHGEARAAHSSLHALHQLNAPFAMKLMRPLISGLLYAFRRRGAFVEVNPQFRDLLRSHGIHGPEDFLNLPTIIVSGHPDRHVGRVIFGSGSSAIVAYLKKEHRLPWRDRWTNAWHGFGWCSRSYRESVVLRAMRETGVGCPEFVAVGEDGRGRAFLLVRELAECLDLRVLLGAGHLADPPARRRFARELGESWTVSGPENIQICHGGDAGKI